MQYTLNSIAAVLAFFAANAAALPAGELEARLAPTNTQSCTAKQYYDISSICQFGQARYGVNVGVPYNNGVGCAGIYNNLNAASKAVNTGPNGSIGLKDFSCTADDAGNTWLNFDWCMEEADTIDKTLHELYPMVNGFNCPNN